MKVLEQGERILPKDRRMGQTWGPDIGRELSSELDSLLDSTDGAHLFKQTPRGWILAVAFHRPDEDGYHWWIFDSPRPPENSNSKINWAILLCALFAFCAVLLAGTQVFLQIQADTASNRILSAVNKIDALEASLRRLQQVETQRAEEARNSKERRSDDAPHSRPGTYK